MFKFAFKLSNLQACSLPMIPLLNATLTKITVWKNKLVQSTCLDHASETDVTLLHCLHCLINAQHNYSYHSGFLKWMWWQNRPMMEKSNISLLISPQHTLSLYYRKAQIYILYTFYSHFPLRNEEWDETIPHSFFWFSPITNTFYLEPIYNISWLSRYCGTV